MATKAPSSGTSVAPWPAADIDGRFENYARIATRWLVVPIVLTSMGTFSFGLLPEELSYLQQIATLLLWCAVIAISILIPPVARFDGTADVVAVTAFYAFAVVSASWSGLTAPTVMKAAALTITTFGAFRLIVRMDIDEIVGATTWALFLLVGLSILVALLFPSIGVNDSWMHAGQWQGIFASKQTLGIVSAHLVLFAAYRKLNGGSWPVFLIVLVVAATGVIASGSRGGGALAVAACLVMYLCSRSTACMRLFAFAPLALIAIACVMILYLYLTGYDSFQVYGTSVDFTERSFIWQYALANYDKSPLFGYGLNGFWTIKPLYDYFEQSHGWVLDNYHNGYIAILIEVGFVGFLLFTSATALITARILFAIRHRSMARSHCTIVIVFLMLSYQINLTETNFLRSTSFMSILTILCQLAVCSVPLRRNSSGAAARERAA